MGCLTEFDCSVFVDGEMPDLEIRDVEEHLNTCASCREMVLAYREESRLLVHYVQEIDLQESAQPTAVLQEKSEPLPRLPRRADAAKFGAGLVGLATLIQLAMSAPEKLDLPFMPINLDWMDPSNLTGKLNLLSGGVVFLAAEGLSKMTSFIVGLSGIAVFALMAAGIVTLLRRSARKSAIVAIVAMMGVLALAVVPGYGMDVRLAQGNTDKMISIPANQTVDDNLFATGDTVIIDGTINGDLIAFARQVIVHGVVKGNVITGAQSIEISGTVEGSIITGGQTIQINSKVSHNVLAFGQSVTLGKEAAIEGDASVFGNETHLNGSVGHSYYPFGLADIAGTVGRDTKFRGATITLLPSARIAGDLVAHVPRAEAVHVSPGASVGGRQTIEIQTPKPSQYRTFGFYFYELIRMLAAFLVGILLLLLFPGLRRMNFSDALTVLKSGGIGFLIMIAMPIAAVIVMITLIGFPIGLIAVTAWLLGLYFAKILVANFLGRVLLLSDMSRFSSVVLSLLLGLLIVFIAINLPYIGWLIHFLVVIVGFGGLILTLFNSFRPSHDFGRSSTGTV